MSDDPFPSGRDLRDTIRSLLYWLVDHDDEMFLTPEQREAKYAARVEKIDLSADVAALGELGLPFTPDVTPERSRVRQRISGQLDSGDGPEGGRPLAYDPDNTLNLPTHPNGENPS